MRPIRTVSLMARGEVGLACARLIARDRGARVASWHAEELAPALARLFPKAERVSDPRRLEFAAACRSRGVDCLLSIHGNLIIPPEVLDAFPFAFNLHPGFLPFGRGYWPTYWALAEGTPAGCTLHRMAPKVDRGAIVAQRRVAVLPTDDGEALRARVAEAEVELFRRTWPRLRSGRWRSRAARGSGTYHSRADGQSAQRVDLDAPTTARRVIDMLRAFTDSRFDGPHFEQKGRRVYMKLKLYEVSR